MNRHRGQVTADTQIIFNGFHSESTDGIEHLDMAHHSVQTLLRIFLLIAIQTDQAILNTLGNKVFHSLFQLVISGNPIHFRGNRFLLIHVGGHGNIAAVHPVGAAGKQQRRQYNDNCQFSHGFPSFLQ